jgi:hypothetical protein
MLARTAKTQAPIFTKIIPPKTPIKKATREELSPGGFAIEASNLVQVRFLLDSIVLRFRKKTFWRSVFLRKFSFGRRFAA